jgi:flavin-dependent dehydrogenase
MDETSVSCHHDALVIGAGPAGAAAAILLAQAGWQVSVVEQHAYPRQKVCGECIAAGNLALLDELGVGQAFRRLAGAELKHVGWMGGDTTVMANMPACRESPAPYGRALGRDVFDALLLERARALGVCIVQPARVSKVSGLPGNFRCEIRHGGIARASGSPGRVATLRASVIIDAHGSWESGPEFEPAEQMAHRPPQRASDLFAFKATFTRSALVPGLLPVVAVAGGYGGLVVADAGRTTVALCLRRDMLRAVRARGGGAPAGLAVESYLRQSCHGVRDALRDARREGSWLSVGPLRPGTRLHDIPGVFRVGNAAGETHPLIGEGISMALQSAKLLVESLRRNVDDAIDARILNAAHRAYAGAWRHAFVPRMRLAALYAHVAMRAPLAAPVGKALSRWPALLTSAARFAGKARPAVDSQILREEPV